ncbi:Nramp family divalent metal transporter [Streptomyces sp. 4N509B]|uniref:Nramp family divalent metal transporter n=1 Tax=Streptomyces sp. 4N509B TaxID=3457413 RepID=UPI003FCF66D1
MAKTRDEESQLPSQRWRLVGPGLVVAATGVGAGDLIATSVAGERFGYTLLWAAVLGCLIKISLAEATGRWHLATGTTIFDGWRLLGPWTAWYFGAYVVVWGFVYGAVAMAASGLPLAALFPDGPEYRFWGICCGLLGLVCVWFNRYAVIERIMTILVGAMFVVVVSVALRVTPDLGELAAGLVPTVPDGSLVYTLGLMGGVGGSITLAAYGFWVNAKGWTLPRWIPVMRLDNRVAYAMTGIFVIAMLIVGAELLHAGQIALASGDQGLLDIGEVLEDRFGTATMNLFLIGFFATAFSSVVGVWHGVSLLFSSFVASQRGGAGASGGSAGSGSSGATSESVAEHERSWPFRLYVLWLTFPPMLLLFTDRPVALTLAYGVIGAMFMPFLAVTLLWLLNTRHAPSAWRNGPVSNVMLAGSAVLFAVLCVYEIRDLPW